MPDPSRGEIWRVRLEPTIGDEIGKTRPYVVLSGPNVGRLALRIVVPITDWKLAYGDYVWMTSLTPNADNGLSKLSAADAFQVRSVSLHRFVNCIGFLPDERMERIEQAVSLCIRS
jgi:mRNA interferase MazF